MNLIKCIESFLDEASCRTRFKEYRDAQGVICRKCGSKEHYWLQTIEKYQCKRCKTRTSLCSGTVMHVSNLPFRHWFIAFHLLTSTKDSFSTLELQRQIGHKFYEPVWYMMQKICKTMGTRDILYQLDKIVEIDEAYFESVDTEKKDKGSIRKRGRGSQKQTPVMVMSSTLHDFNNSRKYKKPTKFRYVRMLVIDNLKSDMTNDLISKNVNYNSVVKTDNYTSCCKTKNMVWHHNSRKVKPEDAGKVLPWVHTMIANAKNTMLGVHHMISKKYAQCYLNEFCYKVNRGYFKEQLFDRLLIACVTTKYEVYITH